MNVRASKQGVLHHQVPERTVQKSRETILVYFGNTGYEGGFGIIRVYNHNLCDTIDNYNSSAYYEPSYIIAKAYHSGGF